MGTERAVTPWLDDGDVRFYHGDALDVLAALPAESVQTVVTSPPYYALRDYGSERQLGLEDTPDEYVSNLVRVFREVWRVLRGDGTVWLNLGDSYARPAAKGVRGPSEKQDSNRGTPAAMPADIPPGLKEKDLVGVPWRVAFALQADGWYLRSDIIWAKPNPMPESVTDRPTKAHEYVFLLSKSPRYYYDADAIREPHKWEHVGETRLGDRSKNGGAPSAPVEGRGNSTGNFRAFADGGRNARSVWDIATQPTPEAHFATFPEELVRRCILAGSAPGDCVLDPFVGSGTTALVARRHGRRAVGIDLNGDYLKIAAKRTQQLSFLA